MTAPALYEIETSEGDDGTMHPVEHLWTPDHGDPNRLGFITHNGITITGYGAEDEPPVGFIALGHHHWGHVIEAAAAYMAKIYNWREFHTYPHADHGDVIPRIPRAVHTHAAVLHHPHPAHPCGCAWDDQWRLVWVPPTEPGAVPVTALRHPAAAVTAAGIPNPDEDGAPAVWAA
ncbi:hypothetical protein [Streptomyces sp. ATexAB-D23]|uniref:hypothetical protein n=1 Tax=unclassified Streptomyces TaxID=2593676 RepID=UPI00036D39D2|nr:hypothetical protein [Streptomyces sp. ATexAB-D23]